MIKVLGRTIKQTDSAYQRRAIAASHRQGKCTDVSFDSHEQKSLIEKIKQQVLTENLLNSLIVFSPANFSYLTGGMILPDAFQHPFLQAAVLVRPEGERMILCQSAYVEMLREQGWKEDILSFGLDQLHPEIGLLDGVKNIIQKDFSAHHKIGCDISQLPVAFVQDLQLDTKFQWVDISQQMNQLRMIKTPKEIELIGEAVRQADRGLVSALNHSEGNLLDSWGYSMWEFAERIRVHIGEMGGHGTGQITAIQGSASQAFADYPDGNLVQGNFLRTETSNHFRGYWSVGGRTLHVGWASDEHKSAYQKNTFLKNAGLALLKPGMRCCDVFTALCTLADKEKIPVISEFGFGHGLGLTEYESPYLNSFDETVLQEGMVLVLSIYNTGPEKELICSKEIVAITQEGAEVLSWYRNWDDLYEMTGNTARHG